MFFKWEYILILAFTIIVDYLAGIFIEQAATPKKRKLFLILSLFANIGVLAVFKYYNFFNENITGLSAYLGLHIHIPYLKILLPIGLSFHTFQAMSYTIEVYRGNYKAERNFLVYALYVMFYPQLVAGPIERPQNMIHQFHEKKVYVYSNVVLGLRLMLWGFVKKVVIADRLSLIVDEIFKNYAGYSGVALMVGVVFYAFQIYCDFSGYSDIAIGSAKVMGYDLMQNFNYPFRSVNISDYWRRWHISLSTWFNDYLYTPILINKRHWGKFAVVFAIMITFFISGLWHGANWTFIVWGLLHGAALSLEVITKKIRKRLSKKQPSFIYVFFSRLLTFTFLIFAWIFFRAENFPQAFYIIKKIFVFDDSYQLLLHSKLLYHFLIGCLMILILEGLQKAFGKKQFHEYLDNKSAVTRWSFYIVMCMLILNFGYFGSNQFIYFQF